jgi:putative membrane protein insertion efficiency factor
VTARLRRAAWVVGWPVRFALVSGVRLYRVTLGQVVGGGCRFYPSCSSYAEDAIAHAGVVRGTALTAWRVLRCSPLSKGGVDHPPGGQAHVYDDDIQSTVKKALTAPVVSGAGRASA